MLENEHGEQRILDGSEHEVIETLDGWTVTELSYLSANASNDQGQVLTDKTKSVEEMYADYDGLIAARPRHNDWGSSDLRRVKMGRCRRCGHKAHPQQSDGKRSSAGKPVGNDGHSVVASILLRFCRRRAYGVITKGAYTACHTGLYSHDGC